MAHRVITINRMYGSGGSFWEKLSPKNWESISMIRN